jgi:hypothetical protein
METSLNSNVKGTLYSVATAPSSSSAPTPKNDPKGVNLTKLYTCKFKTPSRPPAPLFANETYSIDSEIAFIPGFTRRLWFYFLSILVLCITVFVCGWYAYKMSCHKAPVVKYTDGIGTRTSLVAGDREGRVE